MHIDCSKVRSFWFVHQITSSMMVRWLGNLSEERISLRPDIKNDPKKTSRNLFRVPQQPQESQNYLYLSEKNR